MQEFEIIAGFDKSNDLKLVQHLRLDSVKLLPVWPLLPNLVSMEATGSLWPSRHHGLYLFLFDAVEWTPTLLNCFVGMFLQQWEE